MASRRDDLLRLLGRPRSVAVVGASTDPRSPSGRPVDYLTRRGFAGTVVPVNSRSTTVCGLPAVAALRDLEHGSVDVVLVALSAPRVLDALVDAEHVGARVAIVIGSGFEDRASAVRRDLDRFVANSAIRVVGPNCVGTIGVESAAYLTFSSVIGTEVPRPGPVGLVTQSGALGNSLLQSLIRRNVGLAQWVSTGDEVDVGAIEAATGMLRQDGIDVVGLFLEGITDPEWLPELEAVLQDGDKRLFVLKGASSDAGRLAAAGHTGRVVGSSTVSRAILREIGAREVSTVAALADALVVAGTCPELRATRRARVAMVSVSGAAGVIGADRLQTHNRLAMTEIDDAAVGSLTPLLDSRLTAANPLDVPFIDDTTAFADAVCAFATGDLADVVVAVESGLAHDRQELAAKLVAGRGPSAVVLTSLSEDDQVPTSVVAALADAGVAYVPTVDRAVDAIGASGLDGDEPGADGPDGAETSGAPLGMEWVAGRLPGSFPWAPWRVLDDHTPPGEALTEFGVPLVLKAAGRTIAHRTELGAVRIVRTAEEMPAALAAVGEVCAREGDAVLLQAMAPAGFEVMVSALRDPEFGPVVFVQSGGILTERMQDRVALWGGWDRERRDRMLAESAVGQLLDGYRGGSRHDLAALGDVVDQALAAVTGDMTFLELNPVIVHESGLHVVDAVAGPPPADPQREETEC